MYNVFIYSPEDRLFTTQLVPASFRMMANLSIFFVSCLLDMWFPGVLHRLHSSVE